MSWAPDGSIPCSVDKTAKPNSGPCRSAISGRRPVVARVGAPDRAWIASVWRAGIEATMSRFKHQMGMARLRVRGMVEVTYAAMLRALGLNIHRVAAYRAAIG